VLQWLVKPDICHIHWIDDQVWHAAFAGLRPIVATAWGSDLNLCAKAPPDDPLREKMATALRQLDLLIVDSEDMVAAAEALAGQNLRTTLLPIGIDTGQFRPGLDQQRRQWREKLDIGLEATVMIAPRQLGANYRPSEIIRAFSAVTPELRRNAYLIVRTFGHGNGVSLPALHTLTEELDLSNRVRWVGEVEYADLPGLYAASDLAINFPVMDAFPVTFLECFSCGLPVVTNPLPAYQSNGALPYLFCVSHPSVSGLTTALESALQRLDHLRGIAAEAREHVVRNYDQHLTARALKEAYHAVLNRRNI
jgi:glycosyltransferase involved in cell wall biosynthesis